MTKKLIIVLALALTACGAPDAAAGNGSQNWLQTIHDAGYPTDGSYSPRSYIGKYCDTETGNLIYTMASYQGGIAVVPNGCTKNAQS